MFINLFYWFSSVDNIPTNSACLKSKLREIDLQPAHLYSQSTKMKLHALTSRRKKQIVKEEERRDRRIKKGSKILIAELANRKRERKTRWER